MRPLSQFLIIVTVFFYSLSATSQQRSLCSERFVSSFDIDKGKDGNLDCTANENSDIQRKVEKLMRSLNLPMNFVICKRKGSGNASARLDENGIRWIIYDDQFLKKFNTDSSEFESMAILAHEIGHHLSNHLITSIHQDYASVYSKFCLPGSTFDSSKCRKEKEAFMLNYRQQELEADRYAGYLMSKNGVHIEQIKTLYTNIQKIKANPKDVTHPELDKRIEAIQSGYNLAKFSQERGTIPTLQEIKGGKEILYFGKVDKLNRRKLVQDLVVMKGFIGVVQAINTSTRFSFASSIREETNINSKEGLLVKKYLGREVTSLKIDSDEEFLEVRGLYLVMSLDESINTTQYFAIHVKGGMLRICYVNTSQAITEIVYSSPFVEEQISINEIVTTLTEIMKSKLQPIIDAKYKDNIS